MSVDPAPATPDREALQRQVEDVKRLIALGSDITLADGSTLTVVYGARSLARIEDEYGSINAYLAALQETTGGRLFNHLAWTLGLLLHVSVDAAFDQIDTRRVGEYVNAMAAAVMQAMPMPSEEDLGKAAAAMAANNGTATRTSPGAASSTPGSRSSTSRRTTSGG